MNVWRTQSAATRQGMTVRADTQPVFRMAFGIRFFVYLLILMSMTACATGSEMKELKVPGYYYYDIDYEIDWKVFESGKYTYDPRDDWPNGMGGGRGSWTKFYTLRMDFQFKDGRQFHEEVDIEPLIRELIQKYDIPDMSKPNTEYGGGAEVIIHIGAEDLWIEYEVYKRVWNEKYGFPVPKYKYYPLYKKVLKAVN